MTRAAPSPPRVLFGPRRRWLIAGVVVTLIAAALVTIEANGGEAGGKPAAAPTAGTKAAGTDYYVDCSADDNGSGSEASPWNSLSGVTGREFEPGDQILFKRGTTCDGKLAPEGSGAEDAPIVIDTYGAGPKPHIAGGGESDAVRLHNQQYWEIRNLEVTNHGDSVDNRRGVYITLQDIGTGTHYRLTNLTVHDVNGDDKKDLGGSSGIHFDVLKGSVKTKFDDVTVDGNEVYAVDRSGINMSTHWACRASVGWEGQCEDEVETYYPWTGFIVRNNTVHDIGGDGIVMQYTEKGLAEHNVVYDVAARPHGDNAGLWVWNADNVTFQFNEAYEVNKLPDNNDGTAWDADYGTDGTVYQYNYSHDNEGGMVLYCGCGPNTSETRNATVRYNVSVNDKTRTIFAAGADNSSFHNNTVYLPSGSTADIIESADDEKTELNVSNNIIVNKGSGGYSYDAKTFSFHNNILHGNHPGGPSGQITADPKLTDPGSGGTGLDAVDGYQIGEDSPAIGAGAVIPANGRRDYWGNQVPASCAPDIGAHQRSTPDDNSCPSP